MPTRYNVDHQHALLRGPDGETIAVAPGDAHEFSDEDIEAGVSGAWSDADPRSGLEAEQAFKKRRDTAPATTEPEPAPAGAEKETAL